MEACKVFALKLKKFLNAFIFSEEAIHYFYFF